MGQYEINDDGALVWDDEGVTSVEEIDHCEVLGHSSDDHTSAQPTKRHTGVSDDDPKPKGKAKS